LAGKKEIVFRGNVFLVVPLCDVHEEKNNVKLKSGTPTKETARKKTGTETENISVTPAGKKEKKKRTCKRKPSTRN